MGIGLSSQVAADVVMAAKKEGIDPDTLHVVHNARLEIKLEKLILNERQIIDVLLASAILQTYRAAWNSGSQHGRQSLH